MDPSFIKVKSFFSKVKIFNQNMYPLKVRKTHFRLYYNKHR